MMKKVYPILVLLIGIFLFHFDVYAQQYTDINVYGYVNDSRIYIDDNMDDFTKQSTYRVLDSNVEPRFKIVVEDYIDTNSASKNYILVVNYCSTAYPTLSNAVTNGYDLNNAVLLENYSINNAGRSCKVGDYFGNMYQGVFAITRNFAGSNPHSFDLTIWGGATFNYSTYYKFTSIALYDYTEELANSYKSLKIQSEFKNSVDQQTQRQQENHDQIMNSDLNESDKEQPNMDNFNEYKVVEEGILDKFKNVTLDGVNVGLDIDSSNWIWTTLTSLFESHRVVWGSMLSFLSIGIIKLVLGR